MASAQTRRQRSDAVGQLVEARGKKGVTWSVRFTIRDDDGRPRRVSETLGRSWEGMDRRDAERARDALLASVRLGQYVTREQRAAEAAAIDALRASVPTFEQFASGWLERRIRDGGRTGEGLSPKGADDLRWRLGHLNGLLHNVPLDGITPRVIEDYIDRKRAARIGDGGLGARSVNKTLSTLEQVMRAAMRQEIIDRNPVDGRRLPTGVARQRPYIDTSTHLVAMLDAAGRLDDERAARGPRWRRPFLAMLALGGPRINEALQMRRGDVDLGRGLLRIRGTKTAAADRQVPLVPLLRDELSAYIALMPDLSPNAFLFATATGGPMSASNVRRRTLKPTLGYADEALAEAGHEPMPSLTPQGLRRTAASVWFAVGWDLPTVMAAMGHVSERMTLGVYAKAMRLDADDRQRVRSMVLGDPVDTSALEADRAGTSRALPGMGHGEAAAA